MVLMLVISIAQQISTRPHAQRLGSRQKNHVPLPSEAEGEEAAS